MRETRQGLHAKCTACFQDAGAEVLGDGCLRTRREDALTKTRTGRRGSTSGIDLFQNPMRCARSKLRRCSNNAHGNKPRKCCDACDRLHAGPWVGRRRMSLAGGFGRQIGGTIGEDRRANRRGIARRKSTKAGEFVLAPIFCGAKHRPRAFDLFKRLPFKPVFASRHVTVHHPRCGAARPPA